MYRNICFLLLLHISIAAKAQLLCDSSKMTIRNIPYDTASLSKTALRAIQAYGGFDLCTHYTKIEAEVSASGWAFRLKNRPALNHAIIRMDIRNPYSEITPIGKNPLITGVLDGNTVQLLNDQRDTLDERHNARSTFPGKHKMFKWDDSDMAYFANYAFWNYFTLPVLLMDTSIIWTEKENGVLLARFPDDFPTHSKYQEFIFDTTTGLLIQHNYTVDIIGKWARAANVVLSHDTSNQLPYAASRRVTPIKKNGKPRMWPVLIRLEVHSLSYIR